MAGKADETFEVNWAEELGLYVPRLWSEHPGHPFQIRNKRVIEHQGDLYWKNKHLEQMWLDDGVEVDR